MKYTPGPWKVEKASSGQFWILKGIAYSITLISHENAENDANLIVMAPEMAEAIEEFKELAANVHAGQGDAHFCIGLIAGTCSRLLAKVRGEVP